MKFRRVSLVTLFALVSLSCLLSALLGESPEKKPGAKPDPALPEFFVKRELPGMFPCNDCHAGRRTNRTRRELKEAHDDIVLHHAEQNRWCLDCHDANNRDFLTLANGERIQFTESYRLCGQCHGTIFRDWKAGVHGKRTGLWNGKKVYRLCAHCHWPHAPRFKPIKPMSAPAKPEAINIRKKNTVLKKPVPEKPKKGEVKSESDDEKPESGGKGVKPKGEKTSGEKPKGEEKPEGK